MDETKRTVRKTIASGVIAAQRHDTTAVAYACGRLDWVTKNDLPVGTKVEFVAHVPVERKLIRPKDAVWGPDDTVTDETCLSVLGHVYARTVENHTKSGYIVFVGAGKLGCQYRSVEAAQQAAEHELADRGEYGFSWEDDLPEFAAYLVESITAAGHYYLLKSVVFEAALAVFSKRSCDDEPWRCLRLSGVTYDGEHVDITPERKDGE